MTYKEPTATNSEPGLITLAGDLGGTATSPVVESIQGNSFNLGSLGATQDGYVLTWTNSASQWQARAPGSTIAQGVDYQFSNSSSDISGYDKLLDVATGSQGDLSAAVTSGGGKTLIKAFATPSNLPGISVIPAGLWEFNYYGYASLTGAFTTQLVFDVYTRTTGGAETLLFSTTGANLNVTSVSRFTVSFNVTTDTYIDDTQRLVIKVSAQTSNVVSVTAHFVFDGVTNTSLVRTPISGDAIQLGGDLSGTTTSATVININGASVPVSGSLTTGNVLQVSGSSALTYAAVNLAGGANFVTGNLPITNVAPGTSAQVLMSNGTPATTWTTLSSDVTISATGVTTVNSISGSSPISITPTTLQWVTGVSSPTISQASTSGATGTNLTLAPQQSTAATNHTDGSLLITLGGSLGSGSVATFQVTAGGSNVLKTSLNAVAGTNGFLWLGTTASTTSNYALASDTNGTTIVNTASGGTGYLRINNAATAAASWVSNGTNATLRLDGNFLYAGTGAPTSTNHLLYGDGTTIGLINAPSGGTVAFRVNNTNVLASTSTILTSSVPTVQFDNAQTSPTITQASESTVTKGQDLTITPQQSTHATDQGGGNLIVTLQAKAGAGVEAALKLNRGATSFLTITPDSTPSAIIAAPAGNLTIQSASGDTLFLESDNYSIRNAAGNSVWATIASSAFTFDIPVNFSTATVQFTSGISSPTINQAAPSSSSGTGTAATNFAQIAQAGGATTGSATTAGVGGNLNLTAGIGGSGSSGTNAIGGAGGVLNITGGAGGASGGTAANSNGGNVVIASGAAGTGGSGAAGTAGVVQIQAPSTTVLQADATGVVLGKTASSNSGTRIAPLIGSETVFSGIWVGSNAASPSSSNYTLALSPTSGFITASNAGVMNWTSSLLTVTVPNIQWASATSSPTINQGNPTSASGQNLTITAQAGNGSGNNGGNLLLNGGASGGGSGTKGQVQVSSQFILQSNILNDGYFAANTQDATANVVVYTDTAIPSGSVYDFVVTIVGVSPGTVNCYRADYSFTCLNNGGSMVVVGASPVALNVRTNGTGNTFATSIDTSTTTVKVTVTGLSATSIDWAVSFNRVKIS